MPENKTKPTKSSVTAFLNKVKDKQQRDDCFAIIEMMKEVSTLEPVMWGSSIIGFGTYHYVYESGREGEMIIIGFSPRKQNISLYLMGGAGYFEKELARLGKNTTGKGCIYINSLKDVNVSLLKKMFAKSFKHGKQKIAKSS